MNGVPVDTHVHLHSAQMIVPALQAAATAFRRLSPADSRKSALRGVLMLANMKGQNNLSEVVAAAQQSAGICLGTRQWDSPSAQSVNVDGEEILLISGHQVVTRERLEVLALGCDLRPADDMPLEETLSACNHLGALAALPWGAGKWVGTRGKKLHRLAGYASDWPHVTFADSGNRPVGWPWPGPLRRAEANGFSILTGSDPLPVSEDYRAGTEGVWVEENMLSDWQHLRIALLQNPPRFSTRMSIPRFVRLQTALRLRRMS